jgi:DNA repair photolyase
MVRIGITEKGDAGLDYAWMNKVNNFDGMILITKHLSYAFIDRVVKTNSVVHATITGHGGTIYEPNVPPLLISKQYFHKLVEKIGPERVVLRIDPIIPTDSGIAKAIFVYQQLHENMDKKTRVIISFLDNYSHVKDRFTEVGLQPLDYFFHSSLELRQKIASYFPDAQLCGEPGFDCVGCVSKKDLEIFGIEILETEPKIGGFQREECRCLAYKVEMLDKKMPCKSACLYCYWKNPSDNKQKKIRK